MWVLRALDDLVVVVRRRDYAAEGVGFKVFITLADIRRIVLIEHDCYFCSDGTFPS